VSKELPAEKTGKNEIAPNGNATAMENILTGMAHEINNPNNFIMLNAPVLNKIWKSVVPILDEYAGINGDFDIGAFKYSVIRDKYLQSCNNILTGSRRIRSLIDELRLYVGKNSYKNKEINLNDIIRSSVESMRPAIEEVTVRFDLDLNRIPPLWGEVFRIGQVVTRLTENACFALKEKADPLQSFSISTTYDLKANIIELVFRDEGNGIQKDHLPHVTEPFFTTHREYGYVGLGLSICDKIIREHGGTLRIESRYGEGAEIRIHFPVLSKNYTYLV
jgi:signal transduction histidine kinase